MRRINSPPKETEQEFGPFQAKQKPAMAGEVITPAEGDDDDEDPYKRVVAMLTCDNLIQRYDDDQDPDKRGVAKLPSDSLIQYFLVDMRVNADEKEDILAPFPYSAPPSSARWRMSNPDSVLTQHVYEVGGQTTPAIPWFPVTAISGRSCSSRKFLPVQMTTS